MAVEIKKLPLEEAIKEAVEQNIAHDIRLGVAFEHERSEEEFLKSYQEEARHLLTKTGQNYKPIKKGDPWIMWEDFKQDEDT